MPVASSVRKGTQISTYGEVIWRRLRPASVVALALVLAPLSCGGGEKDSDGAKGGESAKSPEKAIEDLPAKQIASRVERIRGLQFKQVPTVDAVTKAESAAYFAKRAGEVPKAEQLAAEEEVKLLGLVPKGATIEGLSSTLGGEAVLGFYDPRKKRLALVAGPGAKDPKALEAVAAHELDHALQDQNYPKLDDRLRAQADTDSDAAGAIQSLVEGDATVLQKLYAKRYGASPDIEGTAAQREKAKKLPFALRLQASFPYVAGAEFVGALAAKSQKLLDRAFAQRPPVSTAQVLHPELYFNDEQPRKVSLSVSPALGGGWRRLDEDTFGELDALTLLAFDEQQVARYKDAAQGWRGGRIELWRKGALDPEACRAPCVERDVVVVGSRWETAKDAEAFAAALGSSLKANRRAKPAGAGAYSVAGGGVAARPSGKSVTVAYAPTPKLASKVARSALGS